MKNNHKDTPHKIIIAAVIALVLISFSGCGLLKKRVEKKENVKYTLNGSNKTSIHIDNTNGRINISNSNDTNGVIKIDVEIIAEVKADEQDKPIDNVKIKIDSSSGEIKIETEVTHTNNGLFRSGKNEKVNYDIKIPANMKVFAENVNGTITITRIKGDIRSETVNGKINIYNCTGKLDLDGVNGTIVCNVDTLLAGINISIVNGDVKVGGLKGIDADVNASTIHGKVKFKDVTFNYINTDKRNLNGTLGKGGNLIRVESTNGSISFEANKFLPKKDDSFEFKIDFDDEDRPIKITPPDDLNEEIGKDNEEQPKTPVKSDSVKK